MTRWLTLIAVLGTLAACGSSAAAPTSRAPRATCGPPGARTLAASGGARVYALGGSVYACAPGSSRRFRLGSAESCIAAARVGPAAAAGGLIAYAVQRCGVDTGSASVLVRRASDGRQLSSHPASIGFAGPESYGSVGSIVVDNAGRLAWIASERSIIGHGSQVQVYESAGSGVQVLDQGSAIRTDSLRLHGSRLTWRSGRSQRSATLG